MSQFLSDYGGLIGLGLGAAGSVIGGQAPNRAGRQARDWTNARNNEYRANYANSLFGRQWLNNNGQVNPGQTDPLASGSLNLFGQNQNTLRRTMNLYGQAQQGFEGDAGRIGQMAGGAEGIARGYGAGSNALIDQQTARAIKAANATSQARLNAGGLGGSTFAANQQANNTLLGNLGAAEQKNEIRRQTTDRVLGARQNRVGTERALSSARTGLATGRAGLFDASRRANTNFQNQALTSQIMNPWLGQSSSQYYPGSSPGGSLFATLGTGIAGLGSAQQQNTQSQEYMDILRQALSRGG